MRAMCFSHTSGIQTETRPREMPKSGFFGASPFKRMEIRPRSGHERYLIYIKESEVVCFFSLACSRWFEGSVLHFPKVAGGLAFACIFLCAVSSALHFARVANSHHCRVPAASGPSCKCSQHVCSSCDSVSSGVYSEPHFCHTWWA